KGRVAGETEVGRKLADMAMTADEKYLLAVDEDADELIVLARSGPALEVLARVPVARAPVSVRVVGDGKLYAVASLWARELAVVPLPAGDHGGPKPGVTKAIPLPFAPRLQLPVADTNKVIVADAFGGKIAVVDVARGSVESVRRLPAHQ